LALAASNFWGSKNETKVVGRSCSFSTVHALLQTEEFPLAIGARLSEVAGGSTCTTRLFLTCIEFMTENVFGLNRFRVRIRRVLGFFFRSCPRILFWREGIHAQLSSWRVSQASPALRTGKTARRAATGFFGSPAPPLNLLTRTAVNVFSLVAASLFCEFVCAGNYNAH